MASGEHSAAASAAGYLYQVRWALLNLLREGRTRPDQVLYLAIRHREKNKGNNPIGRVNGWQPILNVLSMTYGDRLGLN